MTFNKGQVVTHKENPQWRAVVQEDTWVQGNWGMVPIKTWPRDARYGGHIMSMPSPLLKKELDK